MQFILKPFFFLQQNTRYMDLPAHDLQSIVLVFKEKRGYVY